VLAWWVEKLEDIQLYFLAQQIKESVFSGVWSLIIQENIPIHFPCFYFIFIFGDNQK
jgi:hypothetical protein